MFFQQITEPKLSQYAYLLGCEARKEAIIIDPQRDIQRYIDTAAQHGLTIVAVAETHIHADYLSGLRQFAERGNVKILASAEGDEDWQYNWLIGSDYDHQLLRHGDSIEIGIVRIDALHTPGHTPEHLAFVITDLKRDADCPVGMISGDFVFVGDVGRPDLLETAAGQVGTMADSARTLFESLQRFKELSPSMMLWPGHGSGSACGRALGALPVSSVGYELATNPSLKMARDADAFIHYILSGQPEPPAYFARMKLENRMGPAVLRELPQPRSVEYQELDQVVRSGDCLVVDTRPWEEYRGGHIKGALFAPIDRQFPTVIGSYVEADRNLCLIAEQPLVGEAVLDLIRIGLDRVVAFITPGQFAIYAREATMVTIPEIPMEELPSRVVQPDALALDVRGAAELAETGRIEGSHNIAHTQLLTRKNDLPQDKHIHVFCKSKDRARPASGFLAHLGHKVTLVSGGIDSWMKMNRPLTTSPIKQDVIA